MKVTNNSKALQGVHTVRGLKYLQPGETKEFGLTQAQAERAGRLSFIALDGDPVADPLPTFGATEADGKEGVYIPADQFNGMRSQFEAMEAEIKRLRDENDDLRKQLEEGGSSELDRDDLKKQAGELGIEFARNITNEKLKELIDAKLAS